MVESLGSEVSQVFVSNLCGLILKPLFSDLPDSERRALTVTTLAGCPGRAVLTLLSLESVFQIIAEEGYSGHWVILRTLTSAT